MGSSKSGPTPGQEEPSSAAMVEPLAHEGSQPPTRLQVWAIVLSAAVAAGLIGCVLGELTKGFFQPRLFLVEAMGQRSLMPSRESQNAADFKNAILALGILGAVTGLGMGLAGVVAAGSPARGLIVGLGGLVAGGAVGALTAWALFPFLFQGLVPDLNDLFSPILVMGGIWAAIGAVGGLAFSHGLGCRRTLPNAAFAAGAGAFLASVLFHCLSAILFPSSSSVELFTGSSFARSLAMLLVPILVGAGGALGTLGRLNRPSALSNR